MKPFTNKYSIAAGSPVQMGGSYKKSPLEQRVEPIGPHPTGADAYYSPPIGRHPGGYSIVGNKPDDYVEPFSDEYLSRQIDPVSGDPLDYNTTSGTVEMQGGSGAYELKPRKSINLENTSGRTAEARNQQRTRNTQVPITNQEYDTNTWSSTNRENYPRETTYKPQSTYRTNARNFDRNRRTDSIRTVNDRKFQALNQRLGDNNQYLRPSISEDAMNKFGYDTKL
jgi:hypothetical protein